MATTEPLSHRKPVMDHGRGRVLSSGDWSSPFSGGATTSTLIRSGNLRRHSLSSASTFLPRLSTAPSIIHHMSKVEKEDSCQPVVFVRGATLAYSRSGPKVLDCLNLTAEKGQIYGLLGASGCGKTSLLSVVVGRRQLNSGLVQVLSKEPRPGHHLGYMPQEIALYDEFSILETLQYFGRLHGLRSKEVLLQLEFLTGLLDLPPSSRTVGTLSGGQQRRVSFAVSLLHAPDLMILDEPTVGVDPVLRQKVWQHLKTLTKSKGKTVIITTHYIEEARGADRVGFMRGGRLLAEGSPSSLMIQHSLSSLESVFLTLCVSDQYKKEENMGRITPRCPISPIKGQLSEQQFPPSTPIFNIDPVVATLGRQLKNNDSFFNDSGIFTVNSDQSMEESRLRKCCPGLSNLHALFVKNLLKLRRNPAMLLFVFLLPAIQVVFFCVSIGQDPKNLAVGLLNQESQFCDDNSTGCVLNDLGCRMFSGDSQVILTGVNNETEGLKKVSDGELWGLLVIKENFTSSLMGRLTGPQAANPSSLGSQVEVHLDMSNQQVALSLQRWVVETLSNSTASFLSTCQLPTDLHQDPIVWKEPVYGEKDPSFTEFMAPGIIILIIYFLAVALTGESFISERAGGLLERSWVAGVSPGQVLASHILVQFFVMVIQTIVTLSTIIIGFGIPCRGPIAWLAILTIFQGTAGMSFGFLISGLCDSQAVAMQLSIGSFYPNLLLSGILWPLEGMPSALQYIAKFLPNTLACQAMRDIMLRGWGIERPEVYFGLISTSIWIGIFLCLSWIVVKIKS